VVDLNELSRQLSPDVRAAISKLMQKAQQELGTSKLPMTVWLDERGVVRAQQFNLVWG
jgi:hypothetical protein